MKSLQIAIFMAISICVDGKRFLPMNLAKNSFISNEIFQKSSKIVCGALSNAKGQESFYQEGDTCKIGEYNRSYIAAQDDEMVDFVVRLKGNFVVKRNHSCLKDPELFKCTHPDLTIIGDAGYVIASGRPYTNAKQNCIQTYGGHLAIMTKEQHFNAAKSMIEGSSDTWMGIHGTEIIPDCLNEACNGKVPWVDGTSFVYQSWMPQVALDNSESNFCVSITSTFTALRDRGCGFHFPSLCQVFC